MDWQRLKNNPHYWQIFRQRAAVIDRIRAFFKREGFLEVQTPILAPSLIPESYLEIFETELVDKLGKRQKAYLSTSPEMWLKKLLVSGSGNLFEITKSFRNTDIGGHFHNPEFTMLEWYRVGVDYKKTMEDCENLIRFIFGRKKKLVYQGKAINLEEPFERISVLEAFKKYAAIDEKTFFAQQKERDWEDSFNLTYLKEVEPYLGQGRPTIIYDFPAEFAPLSKTSRKDPRLKERFELYIAGIELADAYNELTDFKEQKEQFEKEIELRKKLKKNEHQVDWNFIKALEQGLPDCSGVALGIDRLIMLLTDQADIKEVILFSGEEIF